MSLDVVGRYLPTRYERPPARPAGAGRMNADAATHVAAVPVTDQATVP